MFRPPVLGNISSTIGVRKGASAFRRGQSLEQVLHPYLIESVESACRRKAASVTAGMKRGIGSLASVSATAVLLGLLSTSWGIMNCFHSTGGSRSTMAYEVAGALSQSLTAMVLGLCVAVFALWAHHYLSGCMANFRQEMENQSTDLVNKLILHVRRSGNTQPLFFGEKSKQCFRKARDISKFAESALDAPLLQFGPIYRHGLLELVWPRLQSHFDTQDALQRGMWIAFIGGMLSCWLYSRVPITAAILGSFFLFAGRGVQRGSFFQTVGLSVALLVFAAWQSVLSLDFTFSAFVWSVTAICLTGSLRAAWVASYGSESLPVVEHAHRRTSLSNTLFICLGLVSFAAAFFSSLWDR